LTQGDLARFLTQTQANERITMLSRATFDDVLVTGATWILLAAAAWGAAIAVALALEALTRGRLRSTWACPPALRRGLLAGIGLLVSSGVVPLPATASAPRPGPVGSTIAALPVPARPVDGSPVPTEHGTGRDTGQVVVRRGDTLWAIATRALPRSARAPDVARLVGQLHRVNRQQIGPDPDLIAPGMRLRVPHPTLEKEIQP
jgi:hypothetical protein